MTLRFLTVEEEVCVLREAKRIAVLGIKPETRCHRSAHNIPLYLASVGYEIIPVPVYYPEVQQILGATVYRRLRDIPGPIDIVSIFRKPEHIADHVEDIVKARPRVAWFQSGLLHGPSAALLAEAGIKIVHDCIGCRRAAISPACQPLEGQSRK